MMNAYADDYLNDAMKNLGEAFDYAVNSCKLNGDDFMSLFIASGFAEKFANGNPRVVAGLSGTELAIEVIQKSGKLLKFPNAKIEYDFSTEYWCGWILAYYQWKTSMSFKDIQKNLSFSEVLKLYPTLHEASEEKFADVADAIIKRKSNTSKLQQQRKNLGYSQKKLSELSGVNLRTLQQYESGAKDLGKASVQTVSALAKALGCKIDDLK